MKQFTLAFMFTLKDGSKYCLMVKFQKKLVWELLLGTVTATNHAAVSEMQTDDI